MLTFLFGSLHLLDDWRKLEMPQVPLQRHWTPLIFTGQICPLPCWRCSCHLATCWYTRTPAAWSFFLSPDLWGASQMVWVGKQPWDLCWKSPLFVCLGALVIWNCELRLHMFFSFNKNVAFRVAEKQLENLNCYATLERYMPWCHHFSACENPFAVKLRRFSCYSTLHLCLEIDAELLHLFDTKICVCWSLEEPMWDLPK